jgi:asparagine synthase (glutamine-hydrolysing)
MCGICGIVGRDEIDPGVLTRMTDSIRHRGPDDEGFYVSPPSRTNVGLGFRRLAIIDLDTGNQPIANEDGSIRVVFNGEIYNFPELRDELEARGHVFSTRADTEVIVHLYEELGAGCVKRLNGMFAFAVWDARDQSLLLARDRFGKKPLYYAEVDGGLIFGSELKALLQHPRCPRDLDLDSLARYLAFEYVPEPGSIVSGVRKVPAAHVLTWRSGGTVESRRYWELEFGPDLNLTDDEFAEELRSRFRAAVQRRLLSDVPLGAFLSGGIDSSSVVAAMCELMPASQVKTFSIGFEDRSFDESDHARAVAAYFSTDHHEEVFSPATLLAQLPDVAGWLDEPFADPSVLPTYMLSRFARRHVTVALGGDGGDELLAGYPTFVADRAASLYRVPASVHARVERLAARLPVSTRNFSTDFKIKRFLRGMAYEPEVRHAAWLGAFTPPELRAVLRSTPPDVYEELRGLAARLPGRNRVERMISFYAATYLRDDMLVKVDRASMACSLEVRAPFLDVELAEFLAQVPSTLKLRGLRTKHLLKVAMTDALPPGIANRSKKGFGIPVAEWLGGPLRELVLDELSQSRLDEQGIFRPAEVGRLVDEHLQRTHDHRKPIWTLLMFQLWHRRFVEASAGGVSGVQPAAASR